MPSKPRRLSLVKFTSLGKGFRSQIKEKTIYVFLGEIPNMKGHCVVSDFKSGKIYSGYHTDRFSEVPENET
jgi:hypothetical protein